MSLRQSLLNLLLAAALLGVSAAAALAAPAGSIVGLSGDCVVEAGGNRNPAKLAQAVEVGDTIEVPTEGKLKLRMADGSVVSVAAGTRVTITAYAANDAGQRQDAQLSLSQGLLRAVVTPVTGAPARFEVDTATGAAAVRSTDWFIEATATDMQVNVLSGSVEMTSAATKHAIAIPAGSGSRLEAGHDPLPPRRLSPAMLAALIARTRVESRVRPPPLHPHPSLRERPPPHHGPHWWRPDRFRAPPPPVPVPYGSPPQRDPYGPPSGRDRGRDR